MKKLFTLLMLVMISVAGFSQDFVVDSFGYSVIRDGDKYFDESQDEWYNGKCVALTWIDDVKGGRDLTIPSEVMYEGREYAVKAIAPSVFKDARLGTVNITNGVVGVFFNNAHIRKLVFEDGTDIVGSSYADYTGDEYGLTLPGSAIDSIYFGRAVSLSINSNYCAFVGAGVRSFTFGKNMDRVPIGFLMGNLITKIELPKNILGVLYLAFKDCKELESVAIDSLQGPIYEEAFAGCEKLKRVDIKRCSDIGDKAFMGCSSLEEIKIPSGVVVIGDSAFAGCSNLRTVSLPNSLVQLGASFSFWGWFEYYGSVVGNAFAGCSSLQKIIYSASHPIDILRSNFDNLVYNQVTLCVPVGCKDFYSKVDGWNLFKLMEMEEASKDSLCSLLIQGCGYDSWDGECPIKATIDGEEVENNRGMVYYRNIDDVVVLKFSSGYRADLDNRPCDVDSVFVNGENVTNQLQDNTLTFKVDRSMDISVTYKLREQDTEVSYLEKDGTRMLINGRTLEITNAHIGDNIKVLDVSGRNILAVRATGGQQFVHLPSSGIYIVQVGGLKRKIIVK